MKSQSILKLIVSLSRRVRLHMSRGKRNLRAYAPALRRPGWLPVLLRMHQWQHCAPLWLQARPGLRRRQQALRVVQEGAWVVRIWFTKYAKIVTMRSGICYDFIYNSNKNNKLIKVYERDLFLFHLIKISHKKYWTQWSSFLFSWLFFPIFVFSNS